MYDPCGYLCGWNSEAAAREAQKDRGSPAGAAPAEPPRQRKAPSFDPFGGAKPREVVLQENPDIVTKKGAPPCTPPSTPNQETVPQPDATEQTIAESVEKLSMQDKDSAGIPRDERPVDGRPPREEVPRYNVSRYTIIIIIIIMFA